MDSILFYSPREIPYGCFSNFSRHSVLYQGRNWSTSEAAFQAMKYYPHRLDLVDAAELGRNRAYPIRQDWESPVSNWGGLEGSLVDDGRGPVKAIELVKDLIMYEVVLAKFSQHSDLKSILLGTGTLSIVENAIHDPYWGIGCSGVGVNRLGKVLMLAREAIRAQAP